MKPTFKDGLKQLRANSVVHPPQFKAKLEEPEIKPITEELTRQVSKLEQANLN